MRTRTARWSGLAVTMVLSLAAAACSSDDDDSVSDSSAVATTQPAATEPPATEPAGTEPSATEPAGTEPSATEPAGTEPSATEPPATEPAGEEPQPGGEFTILKDGDVANYDVTQSQTSGSGGGGSIIVVAVYDVLLAVSLDGTVHPRLAESVTSDDGIVWTLTLKPDLTFSDGTPFDAEAVKFNWERHRDPALTSRCASISNSIKTITVDDPVTLTVELNDANAAFPTYLSGCLGNIGSPTAIQEMGAAAFGTAPVGAGPFMWDEYVASDHLTLVRNPSYWDAPKPYLDSINVRFITDPTTRANTLPEDDASAIFESSLTTALAPLLDEGYELVAADIPGGSGFHFNCSRAPFDDVRIRQAFVKAIRPDVVVEKATAGVGEPVYSIFKEDSPYFTGIELPWDDLEGAQALVDEYVAEKGGPVTFTMAYANVTKEFAEAIHQDVSRLENVEINLEVTESPQWFEKMSTGAFDVGPSTLNGPDPEIMYTTRVGTGGTSNYGKCSNPELDQLLAEGRSTTVVEERAETYALVEEIVTEELTTVPLFRSKYAFVPGPAVKGLSVDAMYGFGLWDPAIVWVEQ